MGDLLNRNRWRLGTIVVRQPPLYWARIEGGLKSKMLWTSDLWKYVDAFVSAQGYEWIPIGIGETQPKHGMMIAMKVRTEVKG